MATRTQDNAGTLTRSSEGLKRSSTVQSRFNAECGKRGDRVSDILIGKNETMAKQTVRTMGSQLGRQILRGALGGIFGGKR